MDLLGKEGIGKKLNSSRVSTNPAVKHAYETSNVPSAFIHEKDGEVSSQKPVANTSEQHPARSEVFPKVFIIILSWNGLEDTLECLDSLFRSSYPNFETIVVDNGSDEDPSGEIERRFPGVCLIRNEKNLGYTGGNNIGIRDAIGRGAELIWLLNNDTIVESDTLKRIVDTAMRSEQVGLVSPVIRYYEEKEKIQFCGSIFDPLQRKIVKVDMPNRFLLDQNTVALWGTALLLKSSVVEKIGLLDDKYFAYHEDEEYSIRLARHGYKAVVDMEATIYHKNSRSTGSNNSPFQVFLRNRNRYFLYMDQSKGLSRIRSFTNIFADSLSDSAVLLEKGLIASSDACLEGIWNGIRNRGGSPKNRVPVPKTVKILFEWMLSIYPYFWVSLLRGDYRSIVNRAMKMLVGRRNR